MDRKLTILKLPKEFYKRNVVDVAKELLGKIIVKRVGNIFYEGKIVEVEAYSSIGDKAAHSFNGKTKRNKTMFEEGGHLYVYFIYGNYFCCNIVTGEKDDGSAVLLRALEPLGGVEELIKNRFGNLQLNDKQIKNLTNGPGKLCQAFDITKKEDGIDLTGNKIFIREPENKEYFKIGISKRIGIKKSSELLWRFYIKNNPFVSR
jgi:DNA-3-methyladenine glycosylase